MKNKYILGLILGIFLIGIVSAGITGYAVSLKKGMTPVTDDNLGQVSVTKVIGNQVCLNLDGQRVCENVGKTITTDSGAKVQIASATPGSLFSRARAEINILPAPTPIRVPGGILIGSLGCVDSDGGLNISIQGHTESIENGTPYSFDDQCVTSNGGDCSTNLSSCTSVAEGFCQMYNNTIDNTFINCPSNKCENGACIQINQTEPTTPSCCGNIANQCKWKEATTLYYENAGMEPTMSVHCDNPQDLMLTGSCGSRNNFWGVTIKQSWPMYEDGWACIFNVTPLSGWNVSTELTAKALCCSV